MTATCAGAAGASPTETEQKLVPFSFYHNPPITSMVFIGTRMPTIDLWFDISLVLSSGLIVVVLSMPSLGEY